MVFRLRAFGTVKLMVILGVIFLLGALVTSTLSARLFSRTQRGTPTSRVLLVLGLLFWIIGVFVLPPVAYLSRLPLSAWLSLPLRLVAAYLVGSTLSRLWYALVP